MMENASADKKAFRREMLAIRRAYPPEEIEKLSESIARRLFDTAEFAGAGTLLCFVSTRIEVDTLPIIQEAWRRGKKVAVPKCVKGAPELTFHYIKSAGDLAEGAFGILEPVPECEECTDFDGALCIVPGLCFDRRGHRTGYGRGYYDRFLSRFYNGGTGTPLTACGVIFEDLLLERIPTEPCDIPVAMTVTDKAVYRYRTEGYEKGIINDG